MLWFCFWVWITFTSLTFLMNLLSSYWMRLFLVFCFFKTGFSCVALAILESLCMPGRLRIQRSICFCFCLLRAGIKWIYHHFLASYSILELHVYWHFDHYIKDVDRLPVTSISKMKLKCVAFEISYVLHIPNISMWFFWGWPWWGMFDCTLHGLEFSSEFVSTG